jgi:hypothetical protein
MLQRLPRSSPVTVGQCSHGDRRSLQRQIATAAMVDNDCYDQASHLLRGGVDANLAGAGWQPRRSWTPVRAKLTTPMATSPGARSRSASACEAFSFRECGGNFFHVLEWSRGHVSIVGDGGSEAPIPRGTLSTVLLGISYIYLLGQPLSLPDTLGLLILLITN